MSPISQVLHKCRQIHNICKLEPTVLIHQDKEENSYRSTDALF